MRRVIFTSILIMVSFALLAGEAFGAEFCVSTTTELQDALDGAASNGEDDIIKVQQGTYTGNFICNSNEGNSITLLGGYTSGCTTRVIDPSNTVLDGEGLDSVLYLFNSNGGDIFLQGFTIQNGNDPDYSGGVYAQSYSGLGTAGNITLTNNTITGNTGGGVSAISESPSGTAGYVILTNNTITGNTADSNAGIGATSFSWVGRSSDVILINNIVAGNTASSLYGGIFAQSYGPTQSGNVTLTNNTITGNSDGDPFIGVGGAFIAMSDNTIDVYNNIIWGNTAPTVADIRLVGTGTANGYNNDYSDMSGSWDNSSGNIDEDPLFADVSDPNPGNWDLHLQSTSPCIDLGKNDAPKLPATDFEGDPRIIDGNHDGKAKVDIGADEYGPLKLISPNGGEIIPSGSPYTILWEASPGAVSFKLKYSMDNGRTWKPITSGIPDTFYDWTVPTPVKNKTKCLMKVIGYDDSDKKVGVDKSDSTFTIEVVKLTWPNGGETLTPGDMPTITWTTHETKNDVARVILKYTKNGGNTWTTIETLTENLGTYDWKTVPGVPKTKSKCLVKVVLKDAKGNTVGSDTSDSYFTIQP